MHAECVNAVAASRESHSEYSGPDDFKEGYQCGLCLLALCIEVLFIGDFSIFARELGSYILDNLFIWT